MMLVFRAVLAMKVTRTTDSIQEKKELLQEIPTPLFPETTKRMPRKRKTISEQWETARIRIYPPDRVNSIMIRKSGKIAKCNQVVCWMARMIRYVHLGMSWSYE